MPIYLFVYGTLMQQENNFYADLIQNLTTYVGKGWVYGKKYDLGAYPGIKLDITSTHQTKGEIYLIPTANEAKLFRALDEYEGYDSKNENDSLFIRKNATIHFGNETLLAWIYEYNQAIN